MNYAQKINSLYEVNTSNFVTLQERLEKAKDDWVNKRFPKVPGDDTYIPLP